MSKIGGNIVGLWIPLVTPMYRGVYDQQSMGRLMRLVEPYVDGYVPCLSTGEGAVLFDALWEEVIADVCARTRKPVVAGIKRKNFADILRLAKKANHFGCEAIAVPVPSTSEKENLRFFEQLASRSPLPIMVYNTESTAFTTVKSIQQLDTFQNVIALKDSSMNIGLFQKLIELRLKGKLRLTILQGMEHQLFASKGCDGFLTSLLNNEPELCKKLFNTYSLKIHKQIMDKFWWQHNLGGEWFITLKALLYSRGILRSAEQVKQMVKV